MPSVKPEILLWARINSRLSKEDAAHKLNIKDSEKISAVDKLSALESGEKEPSRPLLLRMAKQYHLPLLTFYLDKPPNIGDRGKDFRTLPTNIEGTDNVNVDILIRDIKARQTTIRETLIDADEERHLGFIGSHKIEDGVKSVVNSIRRLLNFDSIDYRKQFNYKESFRFLRQKIESQGVFVLLKGNLGSYHSNIPATIFRGFVLSDDIAPFIVINDQDSESAWSFSLIHEMSHLFLGQTGVSGAYFENNIEKFCNNVASEFFLPEDEFEKFKITNFGFEYLKSEISDYAFLQKLSNTHIAYRLYKRGDITKSIWNSLREFYYKKWLENKETSRYKNKQKDGGPSYYILHKYKLGTLVGLVQRLTFAGALTTTKAGMLLEVRPLKVHKLFQSEQFA